MAGGKPFVSVRCNGDAYAAARGALAEIDLSFVAGAAALVKPNAGRLVPPGTGVTTNPAVVAGVLDALKEAGAGRLIVGESPILGVVTLEALEKTGIAAVARERKVPLLDLDEREPFVMPVPDGTLIHDLKVCAQVREVDVVVSVPVMKTHMHTVTSLGIKNMKGVLWRREKVRLHQLERTRDLPEGVKTLDMAIADLATVLRPHLCVVDGSIGMEGLGPSAGDPKPFGTVVASHDALAADAVSARLMGYAPEDVPHLRLAAEKGVGTIAFEEMDVRPGNWQEWESPFAPPPKDIQIEFPNVVLHDSESCSACLSTTVLFLRRYYKEFADYTLADGKLHLAVGKGVEELPDGTILIGNCTARHRDHGVFVTGCPPVASHICEMIRKMKP